MKTKDSAGYPSLPPQDMSYTSAPPQDGYPHAPPPYNNTQEFQPMPQPQPSVVMMSPVPVGPKPSVVTCPSCHVTVETSVSVQAGTKTHIMAILLCAFGCLPCMCLPYCMDSCQNVNHYCPNCNVFLGTYSQ